MKRKNNGKKIVILMAIFLFYPIITTSLSFSSAHTSKSNIFSSSTISIDGDSDLDEKAFINGWSGNGSKDRPYVIDNLSFDSVNGPISIYNTTKHVILSNITVNNSTMYCLALGSGSNITIENCIFSNNNDYSISLIHCDFINIDSININNSDYGLKIDNINDIVISRSIINVSQYCISGELSSNVTILNNRLYSIFYVINGNNNSIIDNDFYNSYGIYINKGTIIKNNRINNGSIYIYNGLDIIVENNIIESNKDAIDIIGENICIINNTISVKNLFEGIYVHDVNNLNIYSNKILNAGIRIDTIAENSSIDISDNNTICGKRFLFINGYNSLKIDGSDIGQIIIINSYNIEIFNFSIQNLFRGVHIKNCYNILFSNGTIHDAIYGMEFIGCRNIKIFNVKIEFSRNGITGGLSESVIDNCLISDISGIGILIFEFNNSLINNTAFINCEDGIRLYYFEEYNRFNTQIVNCYFNYCTNGLSIKTSHVIEGNVSICNNIFKQSIEQAIYLNRNCNNFSIYKNIMLFNGGSTSTYNKSRMQVIDEGTDNHWDDSDGIGNYWSDWQLADSDEDGVVDSARPISTIRDIFDRYPISQMNSSIVHPPVNVDAQGGYGRINVSWGKPTRNRYLEAYHYTLYRAESGFRYDILAVLNEDTLFFVDHSVNEAVNYSYYLVSNNSLGYSKRSEIVTAMIDIQPPVLNILTPTTGSLFNESNVTIEWEVADQSGVGIVELMLDGSGEWINVTSDRSHTFVLFQDGNHVISIRTGDLVGNMVQKNVSFIVDTTPPSIELTWSKENRISWESMLDVFWNCNDTGSGIEGIYIEIDEDPEFFVDPSGSIGFEDRSHGSHSFRIYAVDLAGNSHSINETFFLDRMPPILNILEPLSGTISNTNEITIRWSCSDNDTNILFIRGNLDGVEIFNLSWMNEQYQIVLSDGYHLIELEVCDGAGNIKLDSINITIDTIPPSIVSYSPVGTDVNITESIRVQFSEAIAREIGLITVENVEGVVFWEENELVFQPDLDFHPGENYTVHIYGLDLAGNDINYSWSFRTHEDIENYDDDDDVLTPDEENSFLRIFIISMIVLLLIIILGSAIYLIVIRGKDSSNNLIAKQTDLESIDINIEE